jgi:hypothetical protein
MDEFREKVMPEVLDVAGEMEACMEDGIPDLHVLAAAVTFGLEVGLLLAQGHPAQAAQVLKLFSDLQKDSPDGDTKAVPEEVARLVRLCPPSGRLN